MDTFVNWINKFIEWRFLNYVVNIKRWNKLLTRLFKLYVYFSLSQHIPRIQATLLPILQAKLLMNGILSFLYSWLTYFIFWIEFLNFHCKKSNILCTYIAFTKLFSLTHHIKYIVQFNIKRKLVIVQQKVVKGIIEMSHLQLPHLIELINISISKFKIHTSVL